MYCTYVCYPPIFFVSVFFEPTDRRKATKPLKTKQSVSYSSPNINELRAMAEFLAPNVTIEQTNDLNEVLKLAKIVSRVVDFIIVTLGDKGVVTIKKSRRDSTLVAKLYPIKAIAHVENVSGAGDCFTGGFIFGILSHFKESYNVQIGFQAATFALLSKNTVPSDLNSNNILISEAEYVKN